MNLILNILLLTLIILLAGCSKQITKPEFYPDVPFGGIWNELNDGNGTVDLISIHGMCTHDIDWVNRSNAQIKNQLPNWDESELSDFDVGDIKVYIKTFNHSNKKLRNFSIVWSGLTAKAKDQLAYDKDNTFNRKRATLNHELKAGLLDDCISDAVIYIGTHGKEMRENLNGAIDEINQVRNKTFQGETVFITLSLGSKFLADTLSPVNNFNDEILFSLAPFTRVYMAANQIPLLALARYESDSVKTQSNSTFNTFIKRLSATNNKKGIGDSGPLIVIAFSDPNDLLTWELNNPDPNVNYGLEAVDVIYSNDKTYFGYIENPEAAHRNYLDQDVLWEIIFCGSTRKCN